MIFYTHRAQASSGADNGTKIRVIHANKHKYSISAMCKVLNISRSLIYYNATPNKVDSGLENEVIKIFKESRNNYGTRKIKKKLHKAKFVASRKRIAKIMKKYGLVSQYTVKQFKVRKASCNNDKIENEVNRKFNNRKELEVVVSDLTYVNVNGKWHYICLLVDLFNREIIGHSAGAKKDSALVCKTFSRVQTSLNKLSILHTDRGSEFKNKAIDQILDTFKIKRSLSKKGCPYDNAVAEATFKVVKTEFAFNRIFNSLDELQYELFDYVNWYNNHRIHGSLNYMTPVEFKQCAFE